MGTVAWTVMTIVGLILGVGLGFWLGRLHRTSDTEKLGQVEAELEDYKQRVTEHFSQAAAHFHAIGRQYRELYEHMANGSQDLCKLDQVEGALFSLEQDPAQPQRAAAAAGAGGDAADAQDDAAEKPETTAAAEVSESAETAAAAEDADAARIDAASDEAPRDYAVDDAAEASGGVESSANKKAAEEDSEQAAASESGAAADGDEAPGETDEAHKAVHAEPDTPPQEVLEKAAEQVAEQASDTEPEPEERTYH